MIKINLLDSITDRPTGAAAVEDKVSSPRVQTLLFGLTTIGLLFLGAGYDYISSRTAHTAAEAELENQQRISRQMQAVNQEQQELERKTKDIQVRIDAIQKLKASQLGPSAVLREIKQRFDAVPGLYLKSIEQKGSELIIKGESPNEASVTRFGQSLEFSSGLFGDLNIETLREKAQQSKEGGAVTPQDDTSPALEVVSFTVKCNYNPQKPATPTPNTSAPANQVAKN